MVEGVLLALGRLDVQSHQRLVLRHLLRAREIAIRRHTFEFLILILKLLGVEELNQDVIFTTSEYLLGDRAFQLSLALYRYEVPFIVLVPQRKGMLILENFNLIDE